MIRSSLAVIACLGMIVALLSVLDHSMQVQAWSAVVADASSAGALPHPALAKRLEGLPPSAVSTVLTLTGAAITIIAAVTLTWENRPKQ